ncbi:N-acetyltransferase [Kribbella italica]|uniref:GNAT superfamily N-acetyltransferase n=1 Tax=Kribbella italica TaxID=1540520 RepID=A0A7W9J1H0_9ACTN|nr:N-acetyltransferase [Kribbella italica]MBB5833615.1 GNAT superfamily N-acetyltransferase [Kribbella italica]
MRHNRISEAYFWQTLEAFPTTCLIATTEDGSPVADAQAVQLEFGGRGREQLPAGGWEQAVVWAYADARHSVVPNVACALNISVSKDFQGQGLAGLMLAVLRDAAANLDLTGLLAPVRPSHKHLEPLTPMPEYADRTREDGLPSDPWLRTHVRAGGEIVGTAPTSWLVSGTLEDWRTWTGLPFDQTGPVEVPGALTTVHCDLASNYAVYVEPNVWVRHTLRR